jgi:hypothetical protein
VAKSHAGSRWPQTASRPSTTSTASTRRPATAQISPAVGTGLSAPPRAASRPLLPPSAQ